MEYTKKQFEVLYKSHYQAMYCLAYSITQDAEDSRDAVGEVFAQMWSRQPKINPGSLSGYLLAATRNQSISIVRRRVLTTQLQEEQTEEENLHEELEHEELMDELNRVIREQLTEQDRRILSLHYDDDLTYQQRRRKSRKSPCQSGCGMMPTRSPSASSRRPMPWVSVRRQSTSISTSHSAS